MEHHIYFSWRRVFRLSKLYIYAGLATVPVGLLGYLLTRFEVNAQLVAGTVALLSSLVALIAWHFVAKRQKGATTIVEYPPAVIQNPTGQVQMLSGSACLAGTIAIVTITIVSLAPVEYKPLTDPCRTGTANKLEMCAQ